MRTEGIGFYLFDAAGAPMNVPDSGARPIASEQVEGILAAAGNFAEPRRSPSSGTGVTRVRYDRYRLLGIRSDRSVLAVVYPDSFEEPSLEDLQRMLRRFEARSPLGGHEREATKAPQGMEARRVPWLHIRRNPTDPE